MTKRGTDVATVAPAAVSAVRLLKPLAAVKEIVAAQDETREFMRQALHEGVDYGVIPGTQGRPKRDKKGQEIKVGGKTVYEPVKSLLKPGAEKIAAAFGLVISYHIEVAEVDHYAMVQWTKRKLVWDNVLREKVPGPVTHGESVGLYRYVVRCELREADTGLLRGSGLGICSTLEGKYVDRPRETENTIVKQASKRALVGTVLNTFGLSEEFTQEMEAEENEETEAKVTAGEQIKGERSGTRPPVLETLAQALEVVLPGTKGPNNPFGGAKLSAVPANYLSSVLVPHYAKQIQAAAERNGEDAVDPFLRHRHQAAVMVLRHAETQAAADAAAQATADAGAEPARETGGDAWDS